VRLGAVEQSVNRRRFLTLATSTVASVAIGGSVANPFRFVVERHRLRTAGLESPLRLVFGADLHAGPFVGEGTLERWVDAIDAEEPDLVALGGDLIDHLGGARATSDLLDALARLRAPLGVWAVWGNHDHHGGGDLDVFAERLAAVGVRVLVNEAARPRDDLVVAGIDDLSQGRPDLGAALRARPSGVATVLLSHNPDVLPEVPLDVDVTLAGHTHGGQVCLPGGVPIVTSSRYGRRFASGWVRAPARGYVTRGLGVGWLPVRLFCPAELTVLDLAPAR
jgi:hypothetical protein